MGHLELAPTPILVVAKECRLLHTPKLGLWVPFPSHPYCEDGDRFLSLVLKATRRKMSGTLVVVTERPSEQEGQGPEPWY